MTPLIAGNWKMNTTVEEGVTLARAVAEATAEARGVAIAVLPPFTHLAAVRDALRGTAVAVGAQDVFWEDSGAFTGEVSPLMLRGLCDLVLTGHSERRHLLGETDEQVGRKLAASLRAGLRVMVAVGETEGERDRDETFSVVDRQLQAAFAALGDAPPNGSDVVVAYEPVWAIGTGRTATPEQAEEVCGHIKVAVRAATGIESAQVLYGGSVTPVNAASLFAEPSIDGALVGGASLKAADFAAIVAAAAPAVAG
ncbi:MAG: triose-phosphate isomerase [Candidatus Dormibacteraeota bacterium]|nr:triose-phosphate isomerase [Candidatus Dormibacteraeota bacterium]MBV8445882.1 triose-phosphate isomerase [Candidatus Dormibacteraeota bacterium]